MCPKYVIFIVSVILKVSCQETTENDTLVKVEQGWLRGEKLELVTKDGYYYSFKGIPYAAPPVGKLRFKAPEPPLPWDDVRNATTHGSVCIQYDTLANKVIYGSEDCLFLNVYTPALKADNPDKLYPVMVFIHGGRFESDSGNVDNYGPDFIVQNGVVLVTFNYRLEVLGFLSLENKDVPGNAGMKDQVAALKWVKENIRKFGGDPDNVTIFGQSAGGVSVIMHMLSPMSKNLFKRIIAMSGVPSCDWALPYQPRRRAFILGTDLGIDTRDEDVLLEFLKNVSADKLVGVSPNVLASEEITGKILKMFHFTPVVEKDFGQERFLIEDPDKTIKLKETDGMDVIIGHTSEEGIVELANFEKLFLRTYSKYTELFTPRKILIRSNPDKILHIGDMVREQYFGNKSVSNDTLGYFLDYINDSTYNYDIYRYIKILHSLDKNVFVYKFSAHTSRNIYGAIGQKYNLTVAGHSDDTAYLFDPKRANLPIDKNSTEYKVVQNIVKLFTNFAKSGNPAMDNSLGTVWPAYDNESETYLNIGENLRLGYSLDADSAKFWKNVLEKAELDF